MMRKRCAWGAVTSLLIHLALAGSTSAAQPSAAAISFAAWEQVAAEVQQNWTDAIQSGNNVMINETRQQQAQRVFGALPEGGELDDWVGVVVGGVDLVSKVYEAPAYGFWMVFESAQEGASIVCLAKNWDHATGSESLGKTALSTLRKGDVVRVRGRVRWINTTTLLQANPWVAQGGQSFMLVDMLTRSPDFMPDPRLLSMNGIIGADCIHLVLTSIDVVPVPDAVQSVQAQWEECRVAAAGLQQTYVRFGETYSAVVEAGIECLYWNEQARQDPRLLEALRRWSPSCLDGRFAPPDRDSASPYDMYGRDHGTAEYKQYELPSPGLSELLAEEAEVTALLSRWWDTAGFTRATGTVYRIRDYLAVEQPRAEAALADFEAMRVYLNN